MGKELGQRLRLEHELDMGLMQEIKLTSKNVTDKARARDKARIKFSALDFSWGCYLLADPSQAYVNVCLGWLDWV